MFRYHSCCILNNFNATASRNVGKGKSRRKLHCLHLSKWNNAMGFYKMFRFTNLFTDESSSNARKNYLWKSPSFILHINTWFWFFDFIRSENLRLSAFSNIEHNRVLRGKGGKDLISPFSLIFIYVIDLSFLVWKSGQWPSNSRRGFLETIWKFRNIKEFVNWRYNSTPALNQQWSNNKVENSNKFLISLMGEGFMGGGTLPFTNLFDFLLHSSRSKLSQALLFKTFFHFSDERRVVSVAP